MAIGRPGTSPCLQCWESLAQRRFGRSVASRAVVVSPESSSSRRWKMFLQLKPRYERPCARGEETRATGKAVARACRFAPPYDIAPASRPSATKGLLHRNSRARRSAGVLRAVVQSSGIASDIRCRQCRKSRSLPPMRAVRPRSGILVSECAPPRRFCARGPLICTA